MALSVILVLYMGIGAMSAAGSIAVSRKLLSARSEQIVFGILLAPIAAFYLAFTAYFGADAAWQVEAVAVIVFAFLGFLGMRLPVVLVVGYAAHGLWDLLHELYVHAGGEVGGTSTFTQIPLAYGAFCATYDWCMAVYFFTRREQWKDAWRASAK